MLRAGDARQGGNTVQAPAQQAASAFPRTQRGSKALNLGFETHVFAQGTLAAMLSFAQAVNQRGRLGVKDVDLGSGGAA